MALPTVTAVLPALDAATDERGRPVVRRRFTLSNGRTVTAVASRTTPGSWSLHSSAGPVSNGVAPADVPTAAALLGRW